MTSRNVLRSLAGLACILLSTTASARFISVDGPTYGVSCSAYASVDECLAAGAVTISASDSAQLSILGLQLTFTPGPVTLTPGVQMAVAGSTDNPHDPTITSQPDNYPGGAYDLSAGYMFNWGPDPLGQTAGTQLLAQVMVLLAAADATTVGPISSPNNAIEVDFNYADNVSCSGASFTYNGNTYTPNAACAGADNAFFFNFDPVQGLQVFAPDNWSSIGAPTAVPEPSTLALWSAALALLFIVSRRRRSAKTLL